MGVMDQLGMRVAEAHVSVAGEGPGSANCQALGLPISQPHPPQALPPQPLQPTSYRSCRTSDGQP